MPCKGQTKNASSTELEEVGPSCAAVGLQGCLSLAHAADLRRRVRFKLRVALFKVCLFHDDFPA